MLEFNILFLGPHLQSTGVAPVQAGDLALQSSFFLARGTLLYPGCAAGAHPLHVEVSFVASPMAANQEQLL